MNSHAGVGMPSCRCCRSSIAANLREPNDCADDAEKVEGEVCEYAKQVILEPVIAIGIHFSDWVLHPIEKQGMCCLDIVSCFWLLHCQAEKRSLIITHQTEPGSSMRIVEFTTPEIR